MNTKLIEKVWIDDTAVYAQTKDGQIASYSLELWPSLLHASKAEREDFYLSYSGIHWPQIDEDLSYEGMFANSNLCSRTPTEDSVVYLQ
ncbi:MAG: DUF2442 domain-containing protein [Prevotella sp.]|nr:DUF2442 domain-containing protein [Candidatus Prevotella equi]